MEISFIWCSMAFANQTVAMDRVKIKVVLGGGKGGGQGCVQGGESGGGEREGCKVVVMIMKVGGE